MINAPTTMLRAKSSCSKQTYLNDYFIFNLQLQEKKGQRTQLCLFSSCILVEEPQMNDAQMRSGCALIWLLSSEETVTIARAKAIKTHAQRGKTKKIQNKVLPRFSSTWIINFQVGDCNLVRLLAGNAISDLVRGSEDETAKWSNVWRIQKCHLLLERLWGGSHFSNRGIPVNGN